FPLPYPISHINEMLSEGQAPTETEVAMRALWHHSKQLPGTAVLSDDSKSYNFEISIPQSDGTKAAQKVTVLNSAAALREAGKSRPTTASTFKEWLRALAPEGGTTEDPKEVLVVLNAPYGLRMAEE